MPQSKEDILSEARKRFEKVDAFETYFRTNYLADLKFYYADEFNNWQWDDYVVNDRVQLNKPVLTINRSKVLCDSIINDGRQNQPSIKIRAVGNSSSYRSAEIYEGVIRHIEAQSQAQEAYDTASFHQIVAGYGAWRVITKYVDDSSMDQDIFIERIADPLSVYLDPDIKTQSGEDARWCFIFKDMPKDEFDRQYPQYPDLPSISYEDDYSWINEDTIRVAEYYVVNIEKDTLYAMPDGMMIKKSEIHDPAMRKQVAAEAIQSREVDVKSIKWYLLGGDKILDEKDVPGELIPVVRLVGKENVIEGNLDRIGHIRGLRSPQRIYNTMNSAGVEAVGYQSKIPWIVEAQSVGKYTDMWDRANTTSFAYLLYDGYDETGEKTLPAPVKAEPPVYPNAYAQSMQIALQDLVEASGQEPSTMGAAGPERSAKAIQERTRQGDRATYHFIYRLAEAIRLTGRVIIGMLPLVYDTQRVIQVLAQDGVTAFNVQVDPNHPQAHTEIPEEEMYSPEDVNQIWNPNIGRYSVICDSGPNYATKRAEGFNAISQLLQEDKELNNVIGDQLFLMMDVPGAEIMAERMKNMINPQALGKGPSPQEENLQKMLAQQHDAMGKMALENQDLKNKQLIDLDGKQLDWYKAETDRLKVVSTADPTGVLPLMREMISQLLGEAINPLVVAHSIENQMLQKALQQFHPEADSTATGGSPPILPDQSSQESQES